jgi:hypothetical protein
MVVVFTEEAAAGPEGIRASAVSVGTATALRNT